ncbi:MAG TPA: hypothetical protein VMN36_04825 [Verrucomicrobiales bacterium]|nr:hypothetical protein [Verrucomicrobiales bacterium]
MQRNPLSVIWAFTALSVFGAAGTALGQAVVLEDNFNSGVLQDHWAFDQRPFETGSVEVGGGLAGGAMVIEVTAFENYWGGFALSTERTFQASAANPLSFEITRVLDEGVGTATRSGVWISDQSRTHYVFFAQNIGEGGWQYNRRINEPGDNAAGAGTNLAAFDALDDDTGSHRMRLVANGSTAQLYLDDVLGEEVPFPLTENIVFSFGVYAREAGDEATGVFDDVVIRSDLPTGLPCVAAAPGFLNLTAGNPAALTVSVPKLYVEDNAVSVTIASSDPSVATLDGADAGGSLTLNFPAGGESSRQVMVQPLSGGIATLELTAAGGLCVANNVSVNVSSALVRNPSFEETPLPEPWPFYGSIGSWQGGSGLNAGGPFGDNGSIPDRGQIAFIQGATTLSQDIAGLEPGETYWLQFYYNARNCCGGTISFSVLFDGQELGGAQLVQPVGGTNPYRVFSASFVAQNPGGILEIGTQAEGDASLVFDAVTLVRRGDDDVPLINPSFEASGNPPSPGYLTGVAMAGWTGEGNYGVNISGAGPFADNGRAPDQDLVAFLQNPGSSLSQEVQQLLPGSTYSLRFASNARSGNAAHLTVTLGEQVIFDEDITPVGGSEPYVEHSVDFVAAAAQGLLRFTQTAEGDQTVLIDDVRLIGQFSGIPCLEISPSELSLSLGQTGTGILVKTSPEAVADGPLDVVLSSSNPDVVGFEGADPTTATITFTDGGALEAIVPLVPAGKGGAEVNVSSPRPVCFNRVIVPVRVISTFLKNPGFESNPPTAFPTYGDVDDWTRTANAGVNTIGGPFHDNGRIPDGNQVGFIQVTNQLFQQIGGLTPGEPHWLQFYYNTRNCCGGTLSFQITLDGTVLFEDGGFGPVGGEESYYFAQVSFVPEVGSGRFSIDVTAEGDASLLFDAFTITRRGNNEVLVINPSFEATGADALPAPGYMGTADGALMQPISGWNLMGNYGVNLSGPGPFADNGTNPDQDSVLFLQELTMAEQLITGLTPGGDYTLSFAYNARSGNASHLEVALDDVVYFDQDVTPVGGTEPYAVASIPFQAPASSVNLRFRQTAEGDQTVLLDDVRVTSSQDVIPCLTVTPESLSLGVGDMGMARVSVPQAVLNADPEISVEVSSSNPAVAMLSGQGGATVTLVFRAGEPATQTIDITALSGGASVLSFSSPDEVVCFNRDTVPVQVLQGIVGNPGFEQDDLPPGVGYGAVGGWTGQGGTGLNGPGGPFHDNATIPDGSQIAFIQGTGSLSQEITGLAPGSTYWLQFAYNARNCCGGTIGLAVRFAGEDLFAAGDVVATLEAYNVVAVPFTPGAATGLLEFATTASGDATVLLDAVNITRRASGNLTVINPSFEAGGIPGAPGYLQPDPVFGWTMNGIYGINSSGAGPLADNGATPDQDGVLFLQGTGSATQTIGGLTPGTEYTLTFRYNAGSLAMARLIVVIDENIVLETDVTAVGGSNAYHTATIPFIAGGNSAEITLGQITDTDAALLLDDVRVLGDTAPVEPLPALDIERVGANQVRLFWAGPAEGVQLRSTQNLQNWQDVNEPVESAGGVSSVVLPGSGGGEQFRLEQDAP